MYRKANPQGGGPVPPQGGEAGGSGAPNKGGDVVDAEYTVKN